MLFDLKDLLKEKGAHLKYTEKIVIAFPAEELETDGPVDVDLTFTNTGNGIWVKGGVSVRVKMVCSRCLADHIGLVVAEIEERLKKSEAVEKDDSVFEIDSAGFVDLAEVIRQNLILNMPIKSVCSKDCKGLTDSFKSKKLPDPRLTKLKEIKFEGDR